MRPEGQPSLPGGTNGQATTENTMRAIVHDTYGSADVLRLAQVPRPEIADNEVLLRVHAAGLDRGVWHLMTGLPYLGRLVFGVRRPKNHVLGGDVAGTVVAVGSAVTRFAASTADHVHRQTMTRRSVWSDMTTPTMTTTCRTLLGTAPQRSRINHGRPLNGGE